jgi:lipopolysaccharide/colanic/teichoic acid biosynthesis glycosyltransferase
MWSFMKRGVDLMVSMILIVSVCPILLVTTIMIYFFLGRPILFQQIRPGLNGLPFKMYKFRSMKDSTDRSGNPLPDDERLTSFGKILRSTSIDELPALWNVLKGEMSLVGPRPLLMEYLPLYSDEQKHRHDIRPGITGWAQVNGRNALSWEERFKLDVWYVNNQTFWLDIKIILLTVKKVFMREDISAEGQATMQKFTGNN